MALVQERNWAVSMAENLMQSKDCADSRRSQESNVLTKEQHPASRPQSPGADPEERTDLHEKGLSGIYVPDEIVTLILSYVRDQFRLAQCALSSHQWHRCATPLLYRRPRLTGSNFLLFVRTICPSINPRVRKSPLAEQVRALDLSALVYQGSRSLTARLLSRTKKHLEVFVAPQATFALNTLPALSKCTKLRTLDLRLVSDAPLLADVFRTIARLESLTKLGLPRSSGLMAMRQARTTELSPSGDLDITWPPNLQHLVLSGGVNMQLIKSGVVFPDTIRSIKISHCPVTRDHAMYHLLRDFMRPLPHLEEVTFTDLPSLSHCALDDVLLLLPRIKKLTVSIEYLTSSVFFYGRRHLETPYQDDYGSISDGWPSCYFNIPSVHHTNLRTLTLTTSPSISSSTEPSTWIQPDDILYAVESYPNENSRNVFLPALRQLRVAKNLLWRRTETIDDTLLLSAALQRGARRDWENGEWIFANMDRSNNHTEDIWEKKAGVWEI